MKRAKLFIGHYGADIGAWYGIERGIKGGGKYVLTIPVVGDLVYQSFDLQGQGCLLIELVLGFADILTDLCPQLQFLVIAEPIVSGPGAVARHSQCGRPERIVKGWSRSR